MGCSKCYTFSCINVQFQKPVRKKSWLRLISDNVPGAFLRGAPVCLTDCIPPQCEFCNPSMTLIDKGGGSTWQTGHFQKFQDGSFCARVIDPPKIANIYAQTSSFLVYTCYDCYEKWWICPCPLPFHPTWNFLI